VNDNDTERWIAMARVILEHVKVNNEPALDFMDRVLIALPSPNLVLTDQTDRSER
jgi:hypothetical protein